MFSYYFPAELIEIILKYVPIGDLRIRQVPFRTVYNIVTIRPALICKHDTYSNVKYQLLPENELLQP